jgi:hypothetical protein
MDKKYTKSHSCAYELVWFVTFFLAATVIKADNYTQWPSSALVTLNTTAAGANVANSVTNFPILIRLNPGNFSGFATTLAGGADIRFAKTNGEHLAYQIERWVNGANNNDTAEIWVRLDTVYGNTTQTLKMLWGKSGAADSSSGSATFPASSNFVGVWHFSKTSLIDTFADGAPRFEI